MPGIYSHVFRFIPECEGFMNLLVKPGNFIFRNSNSTSCYYRMTTTLQEKFHRIEFHHQSSGMRHATCNDFILVQMYARPCRETSSSHAASSSHFFSSGQPSHGSPSGEKKDFFC